MALQGTLDTFALPDVLRLLATTSKTGQLLVQGDQGNGSLFFEDGVVVGGETTLATTSGADEVLFELLRLDNGSFMFDQGVATESRLDPVEVATLITDAEAAHAEWTSLAAVVPSLDLGLHLAEDLPAETTTLDRDRWRLVVAIAAGTTVRALADRLELRELPALRSVRDLLDDGLVVLADAPAAAGNVEPEFDRDGTWAFEADDDGGTADAGQGANMLPPLGDDPDSDDLFDEAGPDDDLPEPLLVGTVLAAPPALLPEEAAALEGQIEDLPEDQRELVERAADVGDLEAAEELLDELPDGAIDRDLMRRFLGSVRS